jgi:iron complex outermembrane receptor protein
MLDFVSFVDRAKSSQELVDITANISGNLFDLPAGPVGLAVGYEYRDQSGSFTPDPVVSAGFGSDIPAQPTRGSFSVNEIYGELSIPILKDAPFFKALEASLAARYSDYSTSGSETTFKAGLTWRPAEDLLLRGAFAQGFRAPTIGELFGTPSRFDQELADPCSNLLGTGGGMAASATVRMNCIAQGVPGDGSYIQNNPQLSVITGGNRALKAETSDSFTIGAVYSPSWLRDAGVARSASIEVNYFNVKVDGAIQAISANTLLGRCAQSNDSFSCAAISRTPSGQIRNISGLLQNIAGLRTQGFDVTFAYRSPETGVGTFGLNFSGNFLTKFTEIVPAANGVTRISREGTERGSPDQAFPKFKSTTTLDWEYKGWSASVTGRYISGVRETEANDNRLKRRLYADVQIGWRPAFLDDRFGITFGVNNVLNSDPPACISCGLNNFDPTTYDVPGQFGYVRLSAKF